MPSKKRPTGRGRQGSGKVSASFRIQATLSGLAAGNITGEELRSYYAQEYAAFAAQRAEVSDDLRDWIATSSTRLEFTGWQRVVRTRYLTAPLSAHGSVLDPAGGRFNFGRIEPSLYPPFPALYIARDKVTARLEVFGQEAPGRSILDRLEIALAKTESVAEFSVSGEIVEVLDITDRRNLKGLLERVRGFQHPSHLMDLAQRLGITPRVANTLDTLYDSMMRPDWRQMPNFLGVPANSQILGQMAKMAGVEAIKYRSVHSNRFCLAVFPENFAYSPSRITLDDPTPDDSPQLIRELNKSTWDRLV